MLETAVRLSIHLITVQIIIMNPLSINKSQTKESCVLSTGKISCPNVPDQNGILREKKKKMLSVENSVTNALQKRKQLRTATHLLKTGFFPKSFHPLTTKAARLLQLARSSSCTQAFRVSPCLFNLGSSKPLGQDLLDAIMPEWSYTGDKTPVYSRRRSKGTQI